MIAFGTQIQVPGKKIERKWNTIEFHNQSGNLICCKKNLLLSVIDPFGFINAARKAKELGFDVYEPKLHQPTSRIPYFCFQSRISALLTASGDIWPCFRGAENAHLGQRLGNVRRQSFREIFLRAPTIAPRGDSEECQSCSLGLNRFNGLMGWMKDTIAANYEVSLSFMRGYDIPMTQLD